MLTSGYASLRFGAAQGALAEKRDLSENHTKIAMLLRYLLRNRSKLACINILRSRMQKNWKHRIFATSAALTFAALSTGAMHAEVIKPVKLTGSEIAGPIFQRRDAVHEAKGGDTTNVITFKSGDSGFRTGVYKSGPLHEVVKNAPGYPYNEFSYFISGGATLTSSDGSVVTIQAGEAVTIPRGWTGTFDTKGYTKMYVTYNPDDIKK